MHAHASCSRQKCQPDNIDCVQFEVNIGELHDSEALPNGGTLGSGVDKEKKAATARQAGSVSLTRRRLSRAALCSSASTGE
jgi:hypothetical protein